MFTLLRRFPLFVLLAGSVALAGPPMITDDPDTPEKGHWEINVAYTAEKRGDAWTMEAPLLDLNYGLFDNVQLKLEGPYLLSSEGSHRHSDFGNLEAGVKWRFLDQEKDGISVSTYPQFAFAGTNRSVRRGLAAEGWEFLLPVEFQYEIGEHDTVFAEVGWAWVEHEKGNLFAGIVYSHAFSEGFDVLAELHTEGEARASAQELVANVGFHWQTWEHAALIGSAGRSLIEGDEPAADFFGYLACQLTF